MKKLLFLYFAIVSFTVSTPIFLTKSTHDKTFDPRVKDLFEYMESKYPEHRVSMTELNGVARAIYIVTDVIQQIRKCVPGKGQNPARILNQNLKITDLETLIQFFKMIGRMDRQFIGLICNLGRVRGFLDIILAHKDATALSEIVRTRTETLKTGKLAELANIIAHLIDRNIVNELHTFTNSWDRIIWSEHESFDEWSQDLETCLEILDQFSLDCDFGIIYHPRPILRLGFHIDLIMRDIPDFDVVYGHSFVKYAIILLKGVLRSSEVHNVILRAHADEHLRSIFETLGQKIPQFYMFIEEFLRDFQGTEREKKRDFKIQNIRFLFPEELYQGFLSRIESR